MYYVCLPDLFVDLLCCQSGVLQVCFIAVRDMNTTAGRNPTDGKIHTAEPAGVIINSAAV